MAQEKAKFIRVPIGAAGFQTMPVEPEKRLQDSEISIELCTEQDAEIAAEGLYACFPAAFWDKMEGTERRPDHITRVKRLAQRLTPSFRNPHMRWVKAVLTSTGQVIGIAGWMGPENPEIHNIFRRSATEHYGWQELMGWSDADIAEMWDHVDLSKWEAKMERDDGTRKAVMGDEPHWYLAPLLTWPEFQGRGVGKKLLTWAIEQADATEPVTPMYLESAPTARAVYMHVGFVLQEDEKGNFVRRGPATVKGLEDEEDKSGEKKLDGLNEKLERIDIDVVAKETEADLAS